jgi:hypothetical protein
MTLSITSSGPVVRRLSIHGAMAVDSVKAMAAFQLRGLVLYGSVCLWLSLGTAGRNIMLSLTALVYIRYAWVFQKYRRARRRFHNPETTTMEMPPMYPSIIPILGSAILIISPSYTEQFLDLTEDGRPQHGFPCLGGLYSYSTMLRPSGMSCASVFILLQ